MGDDKDATIITVTSSSLTKQTMQASSSRTSDGKTEEISKGPSPPARKRKESEQEKKSEVEATPKEDSASSPTVVNVPISVEIPNDKPEATVKETKSPPPKPVAVTKPPETA